MKTLLRFVTGLLFISGISTLVWLSHANNRLADEIAGLEAELGRLSITDIDQVHVVAVKKPRIPPEIAPYAQRVWQFRLYLPAGHEYSRMSGGGRVTEAGVYHEGGFSSSSSSPKTEATQSIISVSLNRDGDRIKGFMSLKGSSSTVSWGDLSFERLLSDDLVVQTLSTPSQGSRSFDRDTILPLLKMYDPDTVKKKTIADREITTYEGGLIVLCPKSRLRALTELRNGRVGSEQGGFEPSWLAKGQRSE